MGCLPELDAPSVWWNKDKVMFHWLQETTFLARYYLNFIKISPASCSNCYSALGIRMTLSISNIPVTVCAQSPGICTRPSVRAIMIDASHMRQSPRGIPRRKALILSLQCDRDNNNCMIFFCQPFSCLECLCHMLYSKDSDGVAEKLTVTS